NETKGNDLDLDSETISKRNDLEVPRPQIAQAEAAVPSAGGKDQPHLDRKIQKPKVNGNVNGGLQENPKTGPESPRYLGLTQQPGEHDGGFQARVMAAREKHKKSETP